MDTIGERLKAERVRLGMSQQEIAVACGVQRRAQIRYESNERCPDGLYLSAIALIGADIQYVLTGKTVRPELVEGSASTSSARTESHTHLQAVPKPKRRSTDIDASDMCYRRAEKMAQMMEKLSEEQQKEMFFILEKECEFNQMKSQLNELQQRVAG